MQTFFKGRANLRYFIKRWGTATRGALKDNIKKSLLILRGEIDTDRMKNRKEKERKKSWDQVFKQKEVLC